MQVLKPKYHVEEVLKEIRECLVESWTGMGFKTIEFENKWSEYTGHPYSHFLNSATAGLNLSLQIYKEHFSWDENAEVITTGLTFVSTNHAIVKAGLKPVFADIDDTLCLDPASVRNLLSNKTKAIVYVGVGGNPGNFGEIVNIARENNLILILDAAHMAGTKINGITPGIKADCTVYSFQAVKNLPTADSGMICFKVKNFDSLVRKYAWLGINKDTFSRFNRQSGNYKWKYDVDYLGDKYHGNSVIAAIGIVQLKYLDKDNEYRRHLSKIYDEQLKKIPTIKFISIPENITNSRHLYQIMVNNRDELIDFLQSYDIYPGVHYLNNLEFSFYKRMNIQMNYLPNLKEISDKLISLPLHLDLNKEDIISVVNKIQEFHSIKKGN